MPNSPHSLDFFRSTYSTIFARVLFALNVVACVAFWFVGPIHERMQHQGGSWLTIEIRCLILALNAIAYYLILRKLSSISMSILVINSIVIFVGLLNQKSGVTFSIVFAFWDVIVLLLFWGLDCLRRRKPTQLPSK